MMDNPNLEYIVQLADGDTEFEQQFITILKEEFPKEKKAYLKSIKENNLAEAGQLVHKLKHKCNILGMENAYRLSVKFEDDLKANNIDRNVEFMYIMDLMETFIKKI